MGLAILHDFLTYWYKCSQPAATSQGVRSEKIDKTVMDIYEHISRLGGRIVVIDDRLARWEKQMIKLEKQQEVESEKRKAAESRMASFDQSIDKAVCSILASVALLRPAFPKYLPIQSLSGSLSRGRRSLILGLSAQGVNLLKLCMVS